MKALRVLDDIRRLFSTKADNLSYNNGQLQLTADNKPIGLPLSIVIGGSINSFVSGVNNGIFIAPTNSVSTFTIADYQSSKIVTLIKENYVLVQNKDFSIDNTGLVTLSYPLEKDQFVAWVMMHTTYDYNDLANKPTIGSGGGVSLKISETEPSTELVSGLVWYRPSTRSLAMYIETTGFIKLNSSEGEVQMFEQVFTAVAPIGVIDITIPDLNARDVLLVDHDGATLYEGINYSINYTESKLNLLAHELKIGESIHIVCIRVSNGSTAVLDKAESIYTAQETGITIVPINIIGFDTSQIYIVDHDGAILHEGVNYEVSPDMKNIQLLNFAMEAGERIHILNIKMISSEATKAMLDDMRDKVTDVVTKVDAKIDIVDIVNDTTSGGVTKVLSAEQGKVINSAIGQIADERGYIKTKQVTDFNLATLNGKYNTFDALNSPISGGHTWTLNVTREETGVISQIAHCVFGVPAGRMFIRHLWGTWSAWKEIAFANEVLSLSGGNIVGNLNIGDTANSALRILKADDGLYSISAWKKNNPTNDFLELILDGSISGDWSFKNAFSVRNAGNGNLYKVYHEGNVTVSTSAPSSTLNNGCIHHVY